MIAEILRKDFIMMCLNNSTQFDKHEYLNWSSGLFIRPFNSALHGEVIIESRLEGP
jgi:hypothetical protein